MKKVILRILKALVIVLILAIIGFYFWAVVPFDVMEEAELAMLIDEDVKILKSEHIYFKPTEKLKKELSKIENFRNLDLGLIIYPGARVDSAAYSPLARAIAKKGYTVVLAQMPLDISVLDIKAANKIIKKESDVESWVISGHSLGGSMAAFYTKENLDLIDGLIFLGSYPSESTDLSDSHIKVLSLYGENDLIATKKEIDEKKSNLPDDTTYVEIKGGNHAQFGWYGDQNGDGKATISYKKQQSIIVEEILEFMKKLN